ncbi:acyl carrier protein [Amycolatopsis bartoniae]|uniref:Carrier domain-containing protein n=1 Tax=Amycolatopsis bartoniae TaxID=941986 RepID=A0A8H9IWD8_9PSEU|nr:acyl carrier protein [Amycolatopsis bartoniae]MBB2938626.1 acyl carrier protein [Amycolatopsis bartoniae]TVT08878.1 acyl carrier protein [Amycolatopsis bartoniae]GHF69652.1 hypothetical protein GCM10017566_49180 [Amycolatopsis bartoniae]
MADQTTDRLAQELRAELAAVLECRPDEVDLAERLTELPGIDSAKLVSVVVACEKRWEVALDEEELFDVRTGQDLCDLVAYSLSQRGAA